MKSRLFVQPVLVLTFLAALFAGTAQIASARPTVAVLGDQTAYPNLLTNTRTWLVATGLFASVDTIDIGAGTPTVATLQAYDAVLVYTTNAPLDGVTLGNNLATYVDGGGGVVEAAAVFMTTWGVDGSWDTYSCITENDSRLFDAASIGTIYDAAHPIVQGLTTLNGGLIRRDVTTGINGATVIMDWSDGNVMLLTNESFTGRIAAVNMHPITTDDLASGWAQANNDIDFLFAQALVWVSGYPWITDPAAGALPLGEVNNAWSQTFTAVGGQTPYTWSRSAGAFPAGLTLNTTTGELSGTPTESGSFTFDITVTDNNGDAYTNSYTLDVVAELLITSPAAGALASGDAGVAWGPVNFTATGGTTPYNWSVSAGTLPPGLTLDAGTGELSGTPTTAGVYNFDVTVTDANNLTDTRSYSIEITDTVAISSPAAGALTEGYVGDAYSVTFTATGGATPYAWSVSAGSLPGGLTLDSGTGVLSGSPTTAGNYSFTIQVQDAGADTDTRAYTLDIVNLPSISSPAGGSSLTEGTAGAPTAYGIPAVTFTATEGVGPYTWSATSLPPGLIINSSTSEISGTPSTAGTYNITVTVTDSNGKQGSENYTIVINPAVSITTASLPDGMETAAYDTTVATAGGTGPFTWSMVITPALGDLSINSSTGQITGTPSLGTIGSYTVDVTVTDQYGSTTTANLTLDITELSGSIGSGGGCSCSAQTPSAQRSNSLQVLMLLALLLVTVAVRRRIG